MKNSQSLSKLTRKAFRENQEKEETLQRLPSSFERPQRSSKNPLEISQGVSREHSGNFYRKTDIETIEKVEEQLRQCFEIIRELSKRNEELLEENDNLRNCVDQLVSDEKKKETYFKTAIDSLAKELDDLKQSKEKKERSLIVKYTERVEKEKEKLRKDFEAY